jgi:type II secretory pathway pseudopilin PulG
LEILQQLQDNLNTKSKQHQALVYLKEIQHQSKTLQVAQGFAQDASFTLTDDGGAGGTAYDNTTDALLIGVLNGFFYIDSTGKPTFANSVPAGTTTSVNYNTGSDNITAFVIDNPNQEYVVKADAAVTQAMFWLRRHQMNVNNYTAAD